MSLSMCCPLEMDRILVTVSVSAPKLAVNSYQFCGWFNSVYAEPLEWFRP